MGRELPAFLWDISQSVSLIQSFVAGKTLDDYRRDPMLSSAVHHQFVIIGEAIGQAERLFPQIKLRITEHRDIVDFRNRLIHGYSDVDEDVVWETIHRDLPRLKNEVDVLLGEFPL